jgi:threonine synthase
MRSRFASPVATDLERSAPNPIAYACAGCGWRPAPGERLPLRCPRARSGDDIDHVLGREIDTARLSFPTGHDTNPFVRYRTLLHGYHQARAAGWSDADVVARIRGLDDAVREVDGGGFRVTPFGPAPGLAAEIGLSPSGSIRVKDETGNVSGSHKARHLFGTLLELELSGASERDRPLAIASCGNAALAAAVVARAAGRRPQVFIPAGADPAVVERLSELRAEIEVCERRRGAAGDPTYARLLRAIGDGAIPFTCQGNLNAFAIEGGMTLGWELASELAADGRPLDHLVIQVGGGALASAVMQALDEARRLGALPGLPRMHTVQTRAGFPLARAHAGVASEAGSTAAPLAIEAAVRRAARHRSAYMWPWETEPHSIATGILDDETYDWLAVVRGMLRTHGVPVVVDEPTLQTANEIARRTGINVDHTGSAGLAGVLELIRLGEIGPDESVAVIFTGVRRQPPANGGLS